MKPQVIEAEGNELILRNKAGDHVIIPKKHREKVQQHLKEGCHGCIDSIVETLPSMKHYAEDGSLLPSWDTVKAKINPKNWGVEDYSDKGEFGKAYSSARQAGEKEFMWNNKRFSTTDVYDDIISNPKTEQDSVFNDTMKEYSPEFLKYYNQNRPTVEINDVKRRAFYIPPTKTMHVNEYHETPENYGNSDFMSELAHHKRNEFGILEDNIRYSKELLQHGDKKRYETPGTMEYNTHSLTEPALYMTKNGNLSVDDIKKLQSYLKVTEDGILGEETYKAVVSKYYDSSSMKEWMNNHNVPWEVHANILNNEMKDKEAPRVSTAAQSQSQFADYYLYKIGEDSNINLRGLSNHGVFGWGETDDWAGAHYNDEELSKLNPNVKNFNTKNLQRELLNRGYDLPKSTISDADFDYKQVDGVWGDETKQALIDWQAKNKKK